MHVAVLDADLGPHRLQALDVLIDRTRTDGATARQRHARFAATRDQGAEHENRRAHRFDHLVRRQRIVEAAAVENQSVIAVHRHLDPHLADQAQHRRDVIEVRYVRQLQRFGRQQAGTKNRQRGILRAGDGDIPGKRHTALNQ